MEKVNFVERFSNVDVSGEWGFKKEYPSLLVSGDDVDDEIWLSEGKLKIPIGKKKIGVRFFVWLKYSDVDEAYSCMFGMVPDKSSLDDKAIGVLSKLSNRKFSKNPYLHLLQSVAYRYVFLKQEFVKEDMLDGVRESMFNAADHVEAHIVDYLYDAMPGRVKEEGLDDFENGWSVLTRVRSGSL